MCKALAEDAALPADKSRLQARAFASGLNDLTAFLRIAGQTEGLIAVRDTLCKALAEDATLPADRSRVVNRARATNYENLRCFVTKAKSTLELATVAEAIERDSTCAKVLRIKARV